MGEPQIQQPRDSDTSAKPVSASSASLTESQTRWRRVQHFRERHAKAEIALFFAAGFAFDVFTLDRIDNWKNLLQQGLYLLVLGGLLLFDQRYRLRGDEPPKGLRWLYRFNEDAAHFLLGSLLSSFALFFFKSASGLSAFVFLLVIFGLLVANELPRFRSKGPVIRFGLYSLALTSYFAYLLPVLTGRLGWYLFVGAMILAAAPFYLLFRAARRWSGDDHLARRQVIAPALSVQLLLGTLYFVGAIPPVPLSLQYVGVYHDVKKIPESREYELHHERPDWKFWQRGDQTFRSRPGDKVFVFTRIFAPMSVEKGNLPIQFEWFYDHPEKGWTKSGSWTYSSLVGGRAEGFRVFATRSEPRPGNWRVDILAPDGRELGSIGFEVIPDERTEERTFLVDKG